MFVLSWFGLKFLVMRAIELLTSDSSRQCNNNSKLYERFVLWLFDIDLDTLLVKWQPELVFYLTFMPLQLAHNKRKSRKEINGLTKRINANKCMFCYKHWINISLLLLWIFFSFHHLIMIHYYHTRTTKIHRDIFLCYYTFIFIINGFCLAW